MIFRVFIIAVLVAQGLMAFAAPVAAPEMSVPAPSMAAMPECHQGAGEDTSDPAMSPEHCTNSAAALGCATLLWHYRMSRLVRFTTRLPS